MLAALRRHRNLITALLSFGLAVLALALIAPLLDLDILIEGLINPDPGLLIAGVLLAAAYQWARAARYAMVHPRIRAEPGLVRELSAQGCANAALPSGLGTGVLVYILAARFGGRWESYAASALIVRVLDLAALGLLAVAALGLAAGRVAPWLGAAAVVLAAAGLGLAALILSAPHPRRFAGGAGVLRWRTRVRVVLRAARAAGGRKAMAALMAASLGVWILQFASLMALTFAISAPIGLEGFTLTFALGFPVNFLPVQPMANLGSMELVFFVILAPLGYTTAQAATAAMAVRAASILGLVAGLGVNTVIAALAALAPRRAA